MTSPTPANCHYIDLWAFLVAAVGLLIVWVGA